MEDIADQHRESSDDDQYSSYDEEQDSVAQEDYIRGIFAHGPCSVSYKGYQLPTPPPATIFPSCGIANNLCRKDSQDQTSVVTESSKTRSLEIPNSEVRRVHSNIPTPRYSDLNHSRDEDLSDEKESLFSSESSLNGRDFPPSPVLLYRSFSESRPNNRRSNLFRSQTSLLPGDHSNSVEIVCNIDSRIPCYDYHDCSNLKLLSGTPDLPDITLSEFSKRNWH